MCDKNGIITFTYYPNIFTKPIKVFHCEKSFTAIFNKKNSPDI